MRTVAAALAFVIPVLAYGADFQLGSGAPPVALKKSRSGLALEYCPDNTCEVFRSSQASTDVLKDFAVMYLYGIADYVYLQEFQAQDLGTLVGDLSVKYRAKCEGSTSRSRAACLALHLARAHAIKVRFVRYDEGRRTELKVEWQG